MALRLSPRWIESFCQIGSSIEEMAAYLSASGFETEIIDDVYVDPKIVVGEVLSVEKHPNAEKLNVCQVSLGSEKVTIVCGCPTVVNARYVLVAPVGSTLPGIEIGEAELRGVRSQGMICSLKELGLTEDGSGIYHIHESVTVGQSLVDWIQHDQKLLEIDVTPNRGDCLSVYGIARDLSASQNKPLLPYPEGVAIHEIQKSELFQIESDETHAYAALELSINPKRQTPLYMLNRLRQAGMGANHLVVDILNYVMLEIGQPMHGFDRSYLNLPLVVKENVTNSIKLLDDTVYEPKAWDIMVCDQEAPQAFAGIMGGYESRMRPESTSVQLESAVFSHRRIAKSLRQSGLGSDASYRYERGVSIDLNEVALAYSAKLLMQYADAVFSSAQFYKKQPNATWVVVDTDFINTCLGIELEKEEIIDILARLNMPLNGEGRVKIPLYRHDVSIQEDLVEEVARLYGYNNIPLSAMKGVLDPKVIAEDNHYRAKLALVDRGYREVVQFSFVSKLLLTLFPVGVKAVELTNPIHAEYAFMRTHLWQSLALVAKYNYQRQKTNFKLFEMGSVFYPDREPLQIAAIAVGKVVTGYLNEERTVDYYDMQSLALSALGTYGITNVSFVKSKQVGLHPNQAADIVYLGEIIGSVGMMHPEVANALALPETGLMVLTLDNIAAKTYNNIQRPSKFPGITRDITVAVPLNTNVGALAERVVDIPNMVDMELLSVYMTEDAKNVTWSIRFQSQSGTLSDKEIDKAMTAVRKQLEQ